MSDTTETEPDTNANTDTDEPTKAELHERVEQLESTVEKLMPSRRDALRMGAAGIAGAVGLSATSQPADASTGSAGSIGSTSDRPDAFLDEANVNQLTGVSTGADRQGCRVLLSRNQSISQGITKIQFDAQGYDSDSNFDTSSHNWTCPEDGLYMAHLQVNFTGGANDEQRDVAIGTGTTSTPTGTGSFNREFSSHSGCRMATSTINKYSQGDTIAGYAGGSQSDILSSGAGNASTFLEVAFLGGL